MHLQVRRTISKTSTSSFWWTLKANNAFSCNSIRNVPDSHFLFKFSTVCIRLRNEGCWCDAYFQKFEGCQIKTILDGNACSFSFSSLLVQQLCALLIALWRRYSFLFFPSAKWLICLFAYKYSVKQITKRTNIEASLLPMTLTMWCDRNSHLLVHCCENGVTAIPFIYSVWSRLTRA